MSDNDDTNDISRRTLLKGTAATGALAGLSGTAAGEAREVLAELDAEPAARQDDATARRFTLLGIVGGWTGVGPAEIDSRTNPPLRMVEGEQYEVYWINGDGNHHNFNLRNEDGDVVTATEIVEEQGGSQTVTFTAEPELEEYFCAPHPVQMRGPIEFVDPMDARSLEVDIRDEAGDPMLAEVAVQGPGADGSIEGRFGQYSAYSDILARGEADEELGVARFDTLEDGTYTVQVWTYGHQMVSREVTIDGSDEQMTVNLPELTPGEPAQVYELTLENDQWRGEAPDDIAGEANPTLTVTPGETYRVEWTNQADLSYPDQEGTHGFDLPGHNFAVRREDGSAIKYSEFLTEQGETQTVDFVAEPGLGTYLDQSQRGAVGEVAVEEGAGETGADATDAETVDVEGTLSEADRTTGEDEETTTEAED